VPKVGAWVVVREMPGSAARAGSIGARGIVLKTLRWCPEEDDQDRIESYCNIKIISSGVWRLCSSFVGHFQAKREMER
jgi:hypothetical protein